MNEALWERNLPDDWSVVPLFATVTLLAESNRGMLEDNLLSLSYGRIVTKDITTNDGLLPESFETYQIVERGDMVCRFTDLQNDQRSLRTAVACERGIITSAYLAMRPHGALDGRYFDYLFRAYDQSKAFYSFGGGVRQSLKFADVRRLPVVLPPVATQRRIADFLDRETAQIDAVIAKQAELVGLLGERRAAVIAHAVTKGLNPDTPMKDSGVDWLGEVPQHWTIRKLGYSFESLMGFAFKSEDFTHDSEDIRLLRGTNVGIGELTWDDTVRVAHGSDGTDPAYELAEGDLVLGLDRPFISTGVRLAQVKADDLPCYLVQRVDRIRPTTGNQAGWLRWLLSSQVFVDYLAPEFTGVSVPHMSDRQLREFVVGTPPEQEQLKISEHLDRATTRIDTVIAKSQSSIALMRERRAALICDAVTGRLDINTYGKGAA